MQTTSCAPTAMHPSHNLRLHAIAKPTTLHVCSCSEKRQFAVKVYRTMHYDPANPFIVQGDRSILVEVDNPRYAEGRDALAPFAELEKSPEHVHTYRL